MEHTQMTTHDRCSPGGAPRTNTHQVSIGNVMVGGGAPVAVQSMLSCPTTETETCLAQIDRLQENGCEIVRVAIPNKDALESFGRICSLSPLPVVADIHFDYRLGLEAVKRGAAKLRINPGNIGSIDHVDALIDTAGTAGIPIRIGVNAGSLASEYREQVDTPLAVRLSASAVAFVEHFISRGFGDVVVSAKAHDVMTTVETYRRLSEALPEIPLHLGITEAGTLQQGTVKSAVGLGVLLMEGIGDTMRVSLTAPVEEEVRVAWEILAALGLRRRSPELVSCPTCGRCQVDMVSIANEVSDRLQSVDKPLKIAVMGCVVNGPGEAADADIGVACGKDAGVIFANGKKLRKVPESEIIEALFEEIETFKDNSEECS